MENDKQKITIEEIQQKLEESEKKCAEYLAGWQRARADFINYKKEEMERFQEILKYASEELVLKILPILDNIYIADKEIPEELRENQYITGLLKIGTQLEDFLKLQGIEEVETIGKKFDPNLHEVSEIVEPASAEATARQWESGTIIEEIQKGYTINSRLLRPAKVRITK